MSDPRLIAARVRGLLRYARLAAHGWLTEVAPSLAFRVELRELRALEDRAQLELCRASSTPSLVDSERSDFSQNGEDGALDALFAKVGTTNRRFVEIGASDGAENCTRSLAERGWGGLWVEADPARASRAGALGLHGVDVAAELLTPDESAALLDRFCVPAEPDLLVVDIDSADYLVLDTVLRHRKPRVVVAEYNASFPPGRWWVVPTRVAERGWNSTFRHGASLDAITGLLEAHGYGLVGCESTGVNAFFVRLDQAEPVGELVGDVARHWTAPWYTAHPAGHVRSRRVRETPMEPIPDEQRGRIELRDLRRELPSRLLSVGDTIGCSVVLVNGTDRALSGGGPNPMRLSISWTSPGGSDHADDAPRTELPAIVRPGQRRRIAFWTRLPVGFLQRSLSVRLLQEQVFWLDDENPGLGAARLRVVEPSAQGPRH